MEKQKRVRVKRKALTCADPGKWFHDCKGCGHFDGCDYFQKFEKRGTK